LKNLCKINIIRDFGIQLVLYFTMFHIKIVIDNYLLHRQKHIYLLKYNFLNSLVFLVKL